MSDRADTAITQRDGVLAEVAVERLNQDRRWGEQNHPDRMTMFGTAVSRFAYGIESGEWFKEKLANACERGEPTWDHILLEEVAEAMDECARGDTVALRAELVQVAAVAAAWVEAIDRRWTNGRSET